jgi:pyruvate,orthophosphate dikinase
MFGKVVLGVKGEKFESIIRKHKDRLNVRSDVELDAKTLATMVHEFKELVKQETGQVFPEEPVTQLYMAIAAVFQSWNGHRAVVYREANKIPDDLGTAVNIQAMVFGNMGPDSAPESASQGIHPPANLPSSGNFSSTLKARTL